MLLLNVPFKEKDIAKEYGAKWNPEIKKWYVSDRKDYYKFIKWIPGSFIIFDYLYLVIGNRICFKCKYKTKVITFAAENFIDFCDILGRLLDDEEAEREEGITEEEKAETAKVIKETFDIDSVFNQPNDIRFIGGVTPEHLDLKAYLHKEFNYYYRHERNYFCNHCQRCGILQGDYFLSEWDGPFHIECIEKAKDLILYRIPLMNDLAIHGGVSWSSGDELIKEYATIKDFDFESVKSFLIL